MDHSAPTNTTCELRDGFSLVAADPKVFVTYYTIYKNSNPFHRFSWEQHHYAITDASPCYWIYHGTRRIGGVLIRPNLLSGVFLEPPFTDLNTVLGALTAKAIEWSDATQQIMAYGVAPWQVDEYYRHGFRLIEARRNMIRPTEVLPYDFSTDFEVLPATIEHEIATVELLQTAFRGGAGRPITFAEHVDTARTFYHTLIKKSDVLPQASSLVFHRDSGEFAALCHVIEWESWPMIDDIAVRPCYQGRGLATALLKKAITTVAPYYPAIRLFVTVGNPAQSVYYNLGFLPGPEFYELAIPPRTQGQ